MSKINYEYQKSFTFSKYFHHELNKFFDWLETVTGNNMHQGDSSNFSYHSGAKMAGAFQPLADMYKDFRDAFTAYKAPYQKRNNLMQPLRGLGNIFKSLGILLGAPLFFLINTVRLIGRGHPVTMRQNLYQTGTWLIEGMATMLRGLTQVCATPMVYFLETPMRMFITKMNGERKIESNRGIHRKVNEGLNIIIAKNNSSSKFWHSESQDLSSILLDIHHHKFDVYRKQKHQKTGIDAELESKLFSEAYYAGNENTENGYREKIEHSLRYFSLFKPITLSEDEIKTIRDRIRDPDSSHPEFNYPTK